MGMNKGIPGAPALTPLEEPVQRAEIVRNALLNGIIRGDLAWGAQLNTDSIAQQLKVSTTPVRDALNRLEKDGLVVKLPYQGWFVRGFQEKEIRDIYEMRAGLECFAVRLACERITLEAIQGVPYGCGADLQLLGNAVGVQLRSPSQVTPNDAIQQRIVNAFSALDRFLKRCKHRTAWNVFCHSHLK